VRGGGQDLEPERLVKLIDFKHLSDVITEDEALALLRERGADRQQRKAEMKQDGFPAYTTVRARPGR
jgi:L-fuconate dehydratase